MLLFLLMLQRIFLLIVVDCALLLGLDTNIFLAALARYCSIRNGFICCCTILLSFTLIFRLPLLAFAQRKISQQQEERLTYNVCYYCCLLQAVSAILCVFVAKHVLLLLLLLT